MEPRPRTGEDFDSLGNVWDIGGVDDLPRLMLTSRFIERQVHDPSLVSECGPLRGEITARLLARFPHAVLHLVEIAPSHVAA